MPIRPVRRGLRVRGAPSPSRGPGPELGGPTAAVYEGVSGIACTFREQARSGLRVGRSADAQPGAGAPGDSLPRKATSKRGPCCKATCKESYKRGRFTVSGLLQSGGQRQHRDLGTSSAAVSPGCLLLFPGAPGPARSLPGPWTTSPVTVRDRAVL